MSQLDGVSLPPLNCSLDQSLGDYYQDFSQATELVESGYHGPMSDEGVPQVASPGQGAAGNAITTSQYALACLIRYSRGETDRAAVARRQLAWLTRTQQADGEWRGCWLARYDSQKYRWLRAPWTSSLASGNALSALLRGWQTFGDEVLLDHARLAFQALHTAAGLTVRSGDDLWYEEYPGSPALHVLNGHIYTLFGVLDYARATGDDIAWAHWSQGAETVRRHLEEFDLGYWSAYDLRFREPASVYYHTNIHIPQLQILAALTGDRVFAKTAERWSGYAGSLKCKAQLAVGLRMRRFQRSR